MTVGPQGAPTGCGNPKGATYPVTTSAIPDGTAGVLTWYTGADGLTPEPAPSGVSTVVSVLAGGQGTVSIRAGHCVTPGTYYFRVTDGPAVSAVVSYRIGS